MEDGELRDFDGEYKSENMPLRRFFRNALHLDHATAIKADVSCQNYSVCPRHWYVDATCKCERCHATFSFTAQEQKFWFEQLHFYVDSYAKHCPQCRRSDRERKQPKGSR